MWTGVRKILLGMASDKVHQHEKAAPEFSARRPSSAAAAALALRRGRLPRAPVRYKPRRSSEPEGPRPLVAAVQKTVLPRARIGRRRGPLPLWRHRRVCPGRRHPARRFITAHAAAPHPPPPRPRHTASTTLRTPHCRPCPCLSRATASPRIRLGCFSHLSSFCHSNFYMYIRFVIIN